MGQGFRQNYFNILSHSVTSCTMLKSNLAQARDRWWGEVYEYSDSIILLHGVSKLFLTTSAFI
jgi:hypothetical protein